MSNGKETVASITSGYEDQRIEAKIDNLGVAIEKRFVDMEENVKEKNAHFTKIAETIGNNVTALTALINAHILEMNKIILQHTYEIKTIREDLDSLKKTLKWVLGSIITPLLLSVTWFLMDKVLSLITKN